RAYCLKTQPATGETYPKSDLFNKAIQCLKEGWASQAFVRSVLQTFRHHDYDAFLIEKHHRSIVYSDEMWTLAVQLGISKFIRPPKLTHERTRIRVEPFSNGEKEYK
ncbi:hypothetical protein RZP48_25030, partial [Enterobacter asburiae]